jgi:nucleotide-binding universal stress UspA family protein
LLHTLPIAPTTAAEETTMATFQRILVPTDFSETSLYALDYAIDLAKKLGATVTVMHAFELPIYGFPDGALIASAEVASRILNGSTQALADTIAERKNSGVKLETALRQGPADEEIVTLARLSHADLVVMGTHGRRGLARALLGSVAEKVVRTAQCPVLTVHGPALKVEGYEAGANAS